MYYNYNKEPYEILLAIVPSRINAVQPVFSSEGP